MAYISLFITFIVSVLVLGRHLLIPFVLAVFVWFIIREIRQLFKRVKFIREKIPSWLLNVVSTLGLFTIIGLAVSLVSSNIQMLSKNTNLYEANLTKMMVLVNDSFGIDLMAQIKGFRGELNVSKLISQAVNTVSSLFGNVVVILIYILFILLEESGFQTKMNAFYKDRAHQVKIHHIIQKIDTSIGDYLFLKTILSLITGLLSFLVLKIMGVNGAFFWAFLIFLLNYIPTIGSLVATIFPATFAFLQFGEIGPALWIVGILGAIQLVVDNFLEPRLMGNSLNISPVVVLLSLAFWGAIWGIVGMTLSVIITVSLMIILAEFPSTRPFAILLSEKGKLS